MTFGSGGGFTNIQKYNPTYTAAGSYDAYTCPANTVVKLKLQYAKISGGIQLSSINVKSNFGSGTAAVIPVRSTTISSSNYITLDQINVFEGQSGSGGPVKFPATTPATIFGTGHIDVWDQTVVLTGGEALQLVVVGSGTMVVEFVALETSP